MPSQQEISALAVFIEAPVERALLGLACGRRRIGKSTLLVSEARARGGFYYEATRVETPVQLERLGSALGEHLGVGRLAFADWGEALEGYRTDKEPCVATSRRRSAASSARRSARGHAAGPRGRCAGVRGAETGANRPERRRSSLSSQEPGTRSGPRRRFAALLGASRGPLRRPQPCGEGGGGAREDVPRTSAAWPPEWLVP